MRAPADLSYGVAARLRWVTVPAWMLNLFTKKNVPLSSWGTGISVLPAQGELRPRRFVQLPEHVAARRQLAGQGPRRRPIDTDFVQFNGLALWALDVSFVWHTMFNEWFGMHYGAGIGVGIVAGDILRTSNDPALCTEANAGDVSSATRVVRRVHGPAAASCASPATLVPGPDDPTNPHRFADPNVPPVLPIVNIVIGFDFRLPQVRGWEATIEGGFYDAFFLGGGVGYTF